ncbi:hypothetical protein QJS10_CPA02g00465 [Acorus calamus]|uniref:Uncharacterized protein n=1 Tax=Acorus calamus TaxID=4465 RepID=A0AAV9FEL5_ACOCL|nr:hypothetical protein QJS10_CPA02g00465 [Acorus calamus]
MLAATASNGGGGGGAATPRVKRMDARTYRSLFKPEPETEENVIGGGDGEGEGEGGPSDPARKRKHASVASTVGGDSQENESGGARARSTPDAMVVVDLESEGRSRSARTVLKGNEGNAAIVMGKDRCNYGPEKAKSDDCSASKQHTPDSVLPVSRSVETVTPSGEASEKLADKATLESAIVSRQQICSLSLSKPLKPEKTAENDLVISDEEAEEMTVKDAVTIRNTVNKNCELSELPSHQNCPLSHQVSASRAAEGCENLLDSEQPHIQEIEKLSDGAANASVAGNGQFYNVTASEPVDESHLPPALASPLIDDEAITCAHHEKVWDPISETSTSSHQNGGTERHLTAVTTQKEQHSSSLVSTSESIDQPLLVIGPSEQTQAGPIQHPVPQPPAQPQPQPPSQPQLTSQCEQVSQLTMEPSEQSQAGQFEHPPPLPPLHPLPQLQPLPQPLHSHSLPTPVQFQEELHPDPLLNELFRVSKLHDFIVKEHESEELCIKAAWEKELEEVQKKYNMLIQDVEGRAESRKKLMEAMFDKVQLNRILATAMKLKFFGPKAAQQSKQQGVPDTNPHVIFQSSAHQIQRSSPGPALPPSSSPAASLIQAFNPSPSATATSPNQVSIPSMFRPQAQALARTPPLQVVHHPSALFSASPIPTQHFQGFRFPVPASALTPYHPSSISLHHPFTNTVPRHSSPTLQINPSSVPRYTPIMLGGHQEYQLYRELAESTPLNRLSAST